MSRLYLCFKTITNTRTANYEGCRYIKRWVSPTQKDITSRKKKLPPQPEPKRSTFIEWNRDAELYAFNQRLSENFQIEKLNQALIHKSYVFQELQRQKEMDINEPIIDIQHNEDLIEKGREIASQVITKYFIQFLPYTSDSAIVAFHDYLMSEEILATASLHIGTKDIILSGEHPVTQEILAKTFLALVAALAESVNVDQASTFVRDFLIAGLAEKDLSEIWNLDKPFEVLNNVIAKKQMAPVEPRIIGQAGKNTILSAYQIAVYSNKKFLGSGFGQTIEEAKNTAAMNVLCRMFGLLDSSQPLQFDKKIDMCV